MVGVTFNVSERNCDVLPSTAFVSHYICMSHTVICTEEPSLSVVTLQGHQYQHYCPH